MKRTLVLLLAFCFLVPAVVFAFELFGFPYDRSQLPVYVSGDRDLCPDCPRDYKPYIRAGTTWNKVSCSYFAFRAGDLANRDAFRCDGHNHIEFGPLDPGVVAVTAINCTYGQRETGILFNSDIDWNCEGTTAPYQVDLETAALHEFGHMLGLGHTNDRKAIMYPAYIGPRHTLGQDDIDGVCYLYPKGSSGAYEEDPVPPADPEVWVPEAR